jgi:hypothetical protein
MTAIDDSISEAGRVNQQLGELYAAKLEAWKALRTEQTVAGHSLSIPLFLKVSPAYLSATPKIVFVGQETHGWWTDYPCDASAITTSEIMDFYEGAWVELYDKYKRSPYWRAMRRIAEALGVSHPPRSFLFSNIFPCDLDKRQASLELIKTFQQWKILEGELSLLAPDFVIFLCGPYYAYNLEPYFGAPLPESLSKQRRWTCYRPPGHTWKGLVTYHPASLLRSGSWAVLDELVQCIKGELCKTI